MDQASTKTVLEYARPVPQPPSLVRLFILAIAFSVAHFATEYVAQYAYVQYRVHHIAPTDPNPRYRAEKIQDQSDYDLMIEGVIAFIAGVIMLITVAIVHGLRVSAHTNQSLRSRAWIAAFVAGMIFCGVRWGVGLWTDTDYFDILLVPGLTIVAALIVERLQWRTNVPSFA